MANKLLLASCAALTLLMISAVSTPADARRGGHSFSGHSFGGGGARFHAGGHFRPNAHFAHRRFHRNRHIFIGAPFVYGAHYGYGDCYWLRRRALYTGSPYWWNRYQACLYGDGY